jgi:chorismate synthase
VGAVLDGLPPGFKPDWDEVASQMARRAPGTGDLVTSRRESDAPEVLSGFFEGRATGAPVCAIIRNADVRSADYDRYIMRPGHADYTAWRKYAGYADHRGGGHFSGRLTAPIVFAGTLARQVLRGEDGIEIGARIASVQDGGDIKAGPEEIIEASRRAFPVCSKSAGELMRERIAAARDAGDSVGGVIECAATGIPAGWGEPFFRSVESAVSEMMFAIPAVKGVEFGDGFALTGMRGSETNDQMYCEGGEVMFYSNHNGGVGGGVTNGQPLVFRVAVRPTPTISAPQRTVDVSRRESVVHAFSGRHDPCIAPRAAPVAEAALALCLLDLKLCRCA